MQLAADKLAAWVEHWCVSINTEKSSTTLFTLSKKQQAGTIKTGDTCLKIDNKSSNLGVKFNKKQTWKSRIQKADARGNLKLAIPHKLAGTTYGANERINRTVFEGAIRPQSEYESAAWSTSTMTNLQALDRVQKQALRLITGAMWMNPIDDMEKVTNTKTTQVSRKAFDPTPGRKVSMSRKTPNETDRLKRGSFVHQSKKLG